MVVTLEPAVEDSLEWVLQVDLVVYAMSALFVTTNTREVIAHVAAQKCNELTSNWRKNVFRGYS